MPDLNTVPASPHVLATASRRASAQQMPPPPLPTSPSLNILPSNQSAVNQTASPPSLPSPHFAPHFPPQGPVLAEMTSSGPGLGPVRHPRPLTAADLHLELEKEQEAVVNRLTRELSLLRAAQNASVVSNTSSTSASASGTESTHVAEPSSQHLASTSGFSHPLTTNRRHQRTPSSTSTRSLTAAVSTTSLPGISSPAPVRPPVVGNLSLSRQNSTASRRSRTDSPAPSQPASLTQSHLNDPSLASYFANRLPPSSSILAQPGATSSGPTSAPGATPGSEVLSPAILPATTRYEETAYYRSELDAVKRENEALKRQVRELERMVRERRASNDAGHPSRAQQQQQGRSASRSRSDSVSTTASVSVAVAGGGTSIAGQREERPRVVSMLSLAGSVGVGVPEDEVRVGESAASGREGGGRGSLEGERN
ncbi:hypothetical protein CONLIGDRAFT_673671 [Coniochaeta ligniaria NRRL 30616]|uniref:Uncharacterized protein n=1 Tax=Coniochaeta ligniaria NRRL 30616 TaxID=1408157 RepID=A0A1J7IAL8_9PEZI|nr:hypothetical protein CONLIGDRAFT_673671 [Coniochaeta ligniaria NRRL 30616]